MHFYDVLHVDLKKSLNLKSRMIVKVHEKEGKILIAAADSDLIGEKFSDGEKQLDLTSDFYKGEEKTDEEVGDLVRNADYVNLVGEKAVNLGIKEGIIKQEHIL